MSNAALISIRAVRQIAGRLSEATIRRLAGQGLFPRPITLSRTHKGRPCRVAWVEGEVREWCASKIAEDRGLPAPKSEVA
jgi:predicted DNA-binding transcriptional regulator AlpA